MPNYFLFGLTAKVLVSLLFPVILLFAPLVIAIGYYKAEANIVVDQAKRFKEQAHTRIHPKLAMTVALLGFSILSLIAAAILVPVLSPIGILYQFITVFLLFCKGMFSNREVRDSEDLGSATTDFNSADRSTAY